MPKLNSIYPQFFAGLMLLSKLNNALCYGIWSFFRIFFCNNESDIKIPTYPKSTYRQRSGLRTFPGWSFKDVRGDGNCFYYALTEELIKLKHEFIDPNEDLEQNADRLRKLIAPHSQNREWADIYVIDNAVTKLKIAIGVIDTRGMGDVMYRYEDNYEYNDRTKIPESFPVANLAFTGNHYMAVNSGPGIPIRTPLFKF